MKINLQKLTANQADHLLVNMNSAFFYIVDREYKISETKLRDYAQIYNYPQWLASLSLFSVKNATKMGLVDSAALFPLNITKQRVFGAKNNRSKMFNFGFKVAEMINSDYELNKDNTFTGLSVQLAILFSSCIWVDFATSSKKRKEALYQQLWVGFSGSQWKDQYNAGVE